MIKRRSKTPDAAMMGPDPSVLGVKWKYSRVNLAKAFNYYVYYHEIKDARDWASKYMKANQFTESDIRAFNSVKNDDIPMWVCALSKMRLAGCVVPPEWDDQLTNRIRSIVATAIQPKIETPRNVINFPKEVATITLVDSLLDDLYRANYKLSPPDLYSILDKKKYRTTEASLAADYYTSLIEEVTTEKEGYDHLTPKNKKSYLAFLSKVVEDLRLYAKNVRKVAKTRKPRAKKLKSAEQITSKVTFLVEDKALKLVSENPKNIVGASAVWLWNPKYKKMTYLQAEPNGQLSVKGTTIVGFDTKISKSKGIRKPNIIPSMLNMGKVSMLKDFGKLKTKEYPATGRISKDVMIIRVLK